MLHKAWHSKGEMPYCFPRSSIKFQGHTGQIITDFDPNWAFPDYRPVAAFKSLRFALFDFDSQFTELCRCHNSLNVDTYNNSYPMNACLSLSSSNSLRPRQNGLRFTYDNFKCIFFNENVIIAIKISLKFLSKGPIHNISALDQIMAWQRIGDKPSSEPMMTQFNDAYMCHSASMS